MTIDACEPAVEWLITRNLPCNVNQLRQLQSFIARPGYFFDIDAPSNVRSLELVLPDRLGKVQPIIEDGYLVLLHSNEGDLCQEILLRINPDRNMNVTARYTCNDSLVRAVRSLLEHPFEKFVSNRSFRVESVSPHPPDEDALYSLGLPFHAEQLDSLRKVKKGAQFASHGRSMNLAPLEVNLRSQPGKIRPIVQGEYLVLVYRGPHFADPMPLVWIKNDLDKWVSRHCLYDTTLSEEIREMLTNPLFYFVSDSGQRDHCIFCNRELKVPFSLTVGYGPICAKRHNLFWSGD
jgi:hypothetical protein